MTSQPALRPLAALLVMGALFLGACGGDSEGGGGGEGLSEKRAGEIASQFVLDIFGLLTGDTKPQRLIDSFAPECRSQVKASDIAASVAFIAVFLPQLSEVDIEAVDLGKLKFEKTDAGILVMPQDPDGIRLKVKGKFVSANDFFKDLGFDESDDSPTSSNEPLLIVERDGKAYIGDCSQLDDFAGDDEVQPSGTPVTSGRISTPVPNRPGGTRATAVGIGTGVVVEETWRVTVVSVNKDAAEVVRPIAEFFEEPAANERMVLIKVKVENVSKDDESQSIEDFEFEMTGSRNQLYSSFEQKYSCGFLDDALSADLFPKGQATGDLCFRIPRDETNLLLVYDGFFEGDTFLKLD